MPISPKHAAECLGLPYPAHYTAPRLIGSLALLSGTAENADMRFHGQHVGIADLDQEDRSCAPVAPVNLLTRQT